MAGLAATLNLPGAIDALASALAPGDAQTSACRLDGTHGATLQIGVRAAIPSIARVSGPGGAPVAAFAVLGVASVTALDTAYAERGPAGLLLGRDPVAVVVVDAERDAIALARDGDAPGLYYARHGEGWLVASEPGALIEAGVVFEPNVEVIRRFVASGACDDTAQTFYAGVRRVQPGQAMLLTASGDVQVSTEVSTDISAEVGAAVSAGVSAAGPRAAGSAASAAHTQPARLGATLSDGLGPNLSTVDLDRFLREMGEPVPDLALVPAWATARDVGGCDVTVEAPQWSCAAVSRVSDRLTARYGVGLCHQVRPGEGHVPDGRARLADAEPALAPGAFLRSHLDDATAALAQPRPWRDAQSDVASLRRLHGGKSVDAGALLRAYLVERWLRLRADPQGGATGEPAVPDQVEVGTVRWMRIPVRTRTFLPGDRVAPTVASHVAEAMAALRGDPHAPIGPWFVGVSAKVVAVSQRRLCPLWQIKPGISARALARLARRPLPWLGESWTMQVAIDEGGLLPVAAGTVAAGLGRPRWAARLLPEEAALLAPPRADAVAPANVAVVSTPFRPDEAAAVILDALRYALAPGQVDSLAGCAVVAADEGGSRVLGFAAGPYVDAVPDAEQTIAEILADNPCGQGREQTPIVLAVPAVDPQRRIMGLELFGEGGVLRAHQRAQALLER